MNFYALLTLCINLDRLISLRMGVIPIEHHITSSLCQKSYQFK